MRILKRKSGNGQRRLRKTNLGLIYSQTTLTVIAAAGTVLTLPTDCREPLQHCESTQHLFRLVPEDLPSPTASGMSLQNRSGTIEAGYIKKSCFLADGWCLWKISSTSNAEPCTAQSRLSLPLRSLHISDGQRFPEKLDIWKVFPNRGVGIELLSPRDRMEEFCWKWRFLGSRPLTK